MYIYVYLYIYTQISDYIYFMFEREIISAYDESYVLSTAHIEQSIFHQFFEFCDYPGVYLSKNTSLRLTHTTSDVYIYICV